MNYLFYNSFLDPAHRTRITYVLSKRKWKQGPENDTEQAKILIEPLLSLYNWNYQNNQDNLSDF